MRAILILVITTMVISTSGAHSQAPAMLVGTWRLVSVETRNSTGQVQYPLGQHVVGQLFYDARGNMGAQLVGENRLAFASPDPFRGTDAEVRAAFQGYAAYFGTYTVDPVKQTVTHHVRGALFPNWTGGDQLRYYKVEGERLILSAPPIQVGGRSLEAVLVWERIS